MNTQEFSSILIDYFKKYTSITSQSSSSNTSTPSTPEQLTLANIIKEDLLGFGIKDVEIFDNATIFAKIIGNSDTIPITFMSHIDTVDIGVSPHINAQVIKFTGDDFFLNTKDQIIFKVGDHPEILNYKNDEIIVTDGTSVLGADDKAGVTVMIALAKYLTSNNIIHGDIYLIFVPDEEIGLRGAYEFDISKLPSNTLSYTIDGGPLGEFGYENFNGASVDIYIKGVSIHPGCAKGILVNPILIANDTISLLDPMDTPEHSENKEGFNLVTDISGNATEAHIHIILRDFDQDQFEKRKQNIIQIIEQIRVKYSRATIEYDIADSYANIANNLKEDRICIDIVEEAMKNLNISMQKLPIRGGTDGAVFSSKGLPTPNLFTGAHDIHSVYEYLPVSSFTKSLETVIEIVRLAPTYNK